MINLTIQIFHPFFFLVTFSQPEQLSSDNELLMFISVDITPLNDDETSADIRQKMLLSGVEGLISSISYHDVFQLLWHIGGLHQCLQFLVINLSIKATYTRAKVDRIETGPTSDKSGSRLILKWGMSKD